ncbi:MAG: hypothetical protein JNK88_09860, partial [Mangrovicoccus sp.]|nr:hypothetical protein [Mangrovicoccus sp.]
MFGRILPVLLPALSLVIVAFGAGVYITETQTPPYRSIASGTKTLYYSFQALKAPLYLGQMRKVERGVPAAEAPGLRFRPGPEATAHPENLLLVGGLNEYRELCPEDGCVAVEIDRSGKVLRFWPFRPEAIFTADITGDYFAREGEPSRPAEKFRPLGVQPYDNGDILVTFQSTGSMFPFSAGVARIAPDGTPVWFRFDYSHHWPTLLPDGRALVPDLVIGEGDWIVPVGPDGQAERLACHTGKPEIDGIHIIAPDGSVERRIDIDAALRASPWAPMLAETTDPCDPLHLNYVDVLNETAPGGALQPGFLLISMRNLSAVAVLDPATDTITAVRRGTFMQQHSAHHLAGSRILMFDNWGGDAMGPGSRLLEVDLATGTERRVFPRPSSPEFAKGLYSYAGSHLDISKDRNRALVSFSGEGRAYEVDIGTGEVILSYDSLHDLRGVPGTTPEETSDARRANL